MKFNGTLQKLLDDSVAYVNTLTPEQKEKLHEEQATSFIRAEMDWPEPKFKWVDGVKVYDSYEDYCA